jgi:hypothetical protein
MESPSSPLLSIVIRTVSRRYPIVKKVLEHIDKTDLGLSIADFGSGRLRRWPALRPFGSYAQ